MTLTGGKRKVNKSLKAWVTFVKKVQKEEKLSYKDAIHRAKQRKDKGEKWMSGGNNDPNYESNSELNNINQALGEEDPNAGMVSEEQHNNYLNTLPADYLFEQGLQGGRRRRRTMRRGRGRSRGRGRTRSRASRRH
jgi:hypothetical protein